MHLTFDFLARNKWECEIESQQLKNSSHTIYGDCGDDGADGFGPVIIEIWVC